MNELQRQSELRYGPGDYIPHVRTTYWAMRIMAYLGTLVFLVAAVGAFLYWRRRLERDALVPVARNRVDRVPVPGRAVRLGADRGRTTALDRAGALEDRGCQLTEREHGDDRHEPGRLRGALHRARASSTSCSCAATPGPTHPHAGDASDEPTVPAVSY